MRSVSLKTFPVPLSAVCLGTARFGGEYDEKRSFDLLDRYYDMGGRFLDTANVYGRWAGRGMNESELTIGKWLQLRKADDMVVTSKCVHWAPQAPSVSRVNRAEAMRDLDESRRSLGMDTIPIYLTHRDDPAVDVRVIVDFMAEMVEKGWITRFGFSNYTAERVRTAVEYMGADWTKLFVGVSNEWSLHKEAVLAEEGGVVENPGQLIAADLNLWKLHRELGVPLIPYSAAAHGFYAKLTDEKELPKAEQEIYAALLEEQEKTGVSVNALSVAYILNSGVPAIPVVAVSSDKQLAEFEDIARWEKDLTALSPFAKMDA
ncbi:MAG: aldo/keto reductase [Clostridia bacterium]|nr:aldo/keto reductase [Clostridia bacterium]